MGYRVTIHIQRTGLLIAPDQTKIEVSDSTALGALGKAVTAALATLRSEMRDFLAALRALRAVQVGVNPPSDQPSGEAP